MFLYTMGTLDSLSSLVHLQCLLLPPDRQVLILDLLALVFLLERVFLSALFLRHQVFHSVLDFYL